MPANKDVMSFFELRAGFEGMLEFAEAGLRFLDANGIAITAKRKYTKKAEGNGSGPMDVTAMAAKATQMFQNRKGGDKKKRNTTVPTDVQEPDGNHVTMKEAAKMLKMSEANIRLMTYDGRLPKPTYEYRPFSKKHPNRKAAKLVIPKTAVDAAKEARKNAE